MLFLDLTVSLYLKNHTLFWIHFRLIMELLFQPDNGNQFFPWFLHPILNNSLKTKFWQKPTIKFFIRKS